MDKHTYSLKTDKIQKLVRQGDYVTAAKISDTMEWAQERNVRLLNAAAEAYVMVGKDEKAIELLLTAYEHSSAGKRILNRLTELALRNDRISDAEVFYKKYLEEAEDDSNRFILRYKIALKKDEPLERKIAILEAYHHQEFEEKWACELADLYQQAGEKEKCVALCDKIILWFGVGPYVERAMELKETFEPLTEAQQEKRDNRAYYEEQVRRIAEESKIANEADENDELARQSAEEHMANYTASVDISMIQEIMDEDGEPQVHPGEYEDERMESVPVVPVEEEAEEETDPIQNLEAEMSPDVPAVVPAEEEAPAEEEPVAAEEEQEEETPEEAPAEAQEASEGLGATKDLESTPGWKEIFRQSSEENTDPTKEIVIPGDFLRQVEEGQSVVEVRMEEPVEATPQDILSQTQEDMPVIAMDEIEQTELESQLDEIAPTVPIGFEHERCLFLAKDGTADATSMAVEALTGYYTSRKREMASVAKILGEKLNQRGLVHSIPQLNHKDLIIDQANDLNDTTLNEILEVLDYLDTDKVFVLMDEEDAINECKLRLMELSQNGSGDEDELPSIQMEETQEEAPAQPAPAEQAEEEAPAEPAPEADPLAGVTEETVLSKKDFIRYAERFAKELECVIDESGYEAIEAEMENILAESGKLTAGDAEDLIEDAADQAEKMTMRRMFSSKYNKEGFLILRKRNFQ